jgi:hypothetical protein
MTTADARAIAERVHRDQLDEGGDHLIAHVRRVAAAVPDFARTAAWLHEVLERTYVSEEELLAAGLTMEELRALRLLARPPGERAVRGYLGRIALIARSAGRSGAVARAVKRSDLADRLNHPCHRPDGWCPPYGRGLAVLSERPA